MVDELGRQAVVGLDAADLGGGDDDLVDPVLLEEAVDRLLVEQIQLGAAGSEQLGLGLIRTLGLQLAGNGVADHAAVAGDEDDALVVGGHG